MILPWDAERLEREANRRDHDMVRAAETPYRNAAARTVGAMTAAATTANPTTGAAGSREAMIAAAPEVGRLTAAAGEARNAAQLQANENMERRAAARAESGANMLGLGLNAGGAGLGTLLSAFGGGGGPGASRAGTAVSTPSGVRSGMFGGGSRAMLPGFPTAFGSSGADARVVGGSESMRYGGEFLQGGEHALERGYDDPHLAALPIAVAGPDIERFSFARPTPSLTPRMEPTYIEPAERDVVLSGPRGGGYSTPWGAPAGFGARADEARRRALAPRPLMGTDYRSGPAAPYDRNPGTDDMDMGEWSRRAPDPEPPMGGLLPGAGTAAGMALGGPIGGMLGGMAGEALPGILGGILPGLGGTPPAPPAGYAPPAGGLDLSGPGRIPASPEVEEILRRYGLR